MAKKTYRTYHLKGLQLLLCDEYGHQMEVNFRSGCQIDSTSKFTTSDENLQKTLESCSSFGRDFYIESVREEKAVETSTGVSVGSALNAEANDKADGVGDGDKGHADGSAADSGVQKVEVADKGEAIEWLKEHNPEACYTAAKLRSKEAFENACRDNNVEFVFN